MSFITNVSGLVNVDVAVSIPAVAGTMINPSEVYAALSVAFGVHETRVGSPGFATFSAATALAEVRSSSSPSMIMLLF